MGYSIFLQARHGGEQHVPNGIGHPSLAPYQAFDTADGREVVVAVQNDREWQRLARDVLQDDALGSDPKLATNEGRVAERDRIAAACAAFFSRLDHVEAQRRLDRAEVPNARVNTVDELIDHPQLAARRPWVSVDTPAGAFEALPPSRFSEAWPPRTERVPAVGEDTEAVLEGIGYEKDEIGLLVRDQVIELRNHDSALPR